jgi:hypothetical protein
MTAQDLARVIPMMEALKATAQWDRSKRTQVDAILSILENGEHQFTSGHHDTYGSDVGYYKIIEEVTKHHRGYVRKYMGKKVLIMMCRRGPMAVRYCIMAVITD